MRTLWAVALVATLNELATGLHHMKLTPVGGNVARRHVWKVHDALSKNREWSGGSFLTVPMSTKPDEISLINQKLPTKKVATSYGEVVIGENPGSPIRVLFDSGSSEFWVPFHTCPMRNHHGYTPSATFKRRLLKDNSPSLMDVEYISGGIHGFDGYDNVRLGKDLVVPHTNISFATNIEIPLLNDLDWDGIIGLGFSNVGTRQRGIQTFFEHIASTRVLKKQHLDNQIGYYITQDGGRMTFGGVDERLLQNPRGVGWVSVDSSEGYWTGRVLGLGVSTRRTRGVAGGSSDVNESNVANSPIDDQYSTAIIDTGTYLTYIPSKVWDDELSTVVLNGCKDMGNLPDIVFKLKGHKRMNNDKRTINLTLTPSDYVLRFTEPDGHVECALGIVPDDADESETPGFTLGQVLMQKYYTIFDYDNKAVGFGESTTKNRMPSKKTQVPKNQTKPNTGNKNKAARNMQRKRTENGAQSGTNNQKNNQKAKQRKG